ncbi:hypothetical protein [Litoribacillus peritrichatus]|uniref:Uncharacterized protein n=1 Tax=Litoribacillus peritrichatus TaxID=718191 RepID=A0ABP7N3K0_9GAMM
MADQNFSNQLKQLALEFESMTDNYPHLLEQAISDPESGKWSPDYFTSLEPYGSEIQHKTPPSRLLVNSPEVLSSDTLSLVLLGSHGAELVRTFYGDKIYYDDIYIYDDNAIKRYQIYHSDGDTKPVLIELLVLTEEGSPSQFLTYYDGASLIINYTSNNQGILSKSYIPSDGALKEYKTMRIDFEDGQVKEIVDLANSSLIYSLEEAAKPLSTLLAEYQDRVMAMIIAGLKERPPEAEDVSGMVLEYFSESPFPPSIGLPTASERAKWKGDSVIWWFNAADMEYFYECEFFYQDNSDELLNAKLEELDFDYVVDIVDAFYLELAGRIVNSPEIRALLSADDNFFCTAHDYTCGTDLGLLKKFLPNSLYQEIESEVGAPEELGEDQVLSAFGKLN